jgi:hypothetical protein
MAVSQETVATLFPTPIPSDFPRAQIGWIMRDAITKDHPRRDARFRRDRPHDRRSQEYTERFVWRCDPRHILNQATARFHNRPPGVKTGEYPGLGRPPVNRLWQSYKIKFLIGSHFAAFLWAFFSVKFAMEGNRPAALTFGVSAGVTTLSLAAWWLYRLKRANPEIKKDP